MVSFLEIVQRFPIGARVAVREDGEIKEREIIGYEYYNGTGYLLFRGSGKLDADFALQIDIPEEKY